jgi:hypothetical protein
MDEGIDQRISVLSWHRRVEVSLLVFSVFLAALFFFSVGLRSVDMRSVFVALTFTYIVLYFWERKLSRES